MSGGSRAAAALVAALALAACGAESPPPEPGGSPVMVERATAHDVVDEIESTGELLAQAEATVAAQVSGEVTGIAADEGSAVEQGDIIIEIDPQLRQLELENARADAAQARARLEEARREAARLESLAGRGAASQARVDEARTAVEMAEASLLAAQARLGLAERALADASVAAPFPGLVARRHVNVGEFVNVGDPLYELVALDPVEVEFFLAEVDSARVAVGQSVSVQVASHAGRTFHAQVEFVSPTIDPETRTRRVRAVIPNPDGILLPGTFARVDLGVAQRSGVVMVPKESVLLRSEGPVLFRLTEGGDRVERVRVETGRHRGRLVEVRGPVRAGDRVVVRGQANLVDGSPVSLRNADGTPLGAGPVASHGGEG